MHFQNDVSNTDGGIKEQSKGKWPTKDWFLL
jgi:hypothetical protein